MNNKYKYTLVYSTFLISIYLIFSLIDSWHIKNKNMQKEMLLQEATTLYNDHMNTRKWNSMYGGVYIEPLEGQEPNPYLKNSVLKVNNSLTLFKINPALMSRQLSKLSNSKNYKIDIRGLNPINPNNKPSDFDIRAIKSFKDKNATQYYEINKETLEFIGAMQTIESCIKCHINQDYKVGTVSGGIHISLNSTKYHKIITSIGEKVILAKVIIFLFLFVITLLIRQQLKNYEELSSEAKSTKKLLQSILDADKSFLFVSDGKDIIFANKTILDFAGFSSLEDFKNEHKHISDKFEEIDDENFLRSEIDGIHWIQYLIQEQDNKELKVLTKKDGKNIYFRPHAKEIKVDKKTLYLITFDNITHEYKTIQELETQALTDPLTGLFNRRKLDDVLEKEMILSCDTRTPLSIIFLDIDHFKIVNDTLGHDVGDIVLQELSKIILDTTRSGDFVARWGGEEFMIALQSTNTNSASKIAEKLRVKVQDYNFTDAGKITISLGVTQLKENEKKDTFTKRVDEALYEAKNSGRNKVVVK